MFKSKNPKYQDIFSALEPAGATINASTSYDRTNFFAVFHKNYLNAWCKAESIRMAEPPFSEKHYVEKRVVQDELRIGNDNPFQQLRNLMANTTFNRSGYSVDTGGYLRDVANTSFKQLFKFHQQFYGPSNAHIIVTGPVSPSFVLKSVLKHFGGLSSEGRNPERVEREEEVQKGVRQVTVNWESPVCLVSMAYRNMAAMEKDSIVADVIAHYLQHPNVGVLSQLSEMSLMPEYACDNARLKNRFLFSITGALISAVPQMQTAAIGMVQQALLKLKTQKVDPNVLQVVKKDLQNKWKNSRSNIESLGAQLTESCASGNIGDVWEKELLLEKVSADDIMRVSNYLFQEDRLTLGLVKPRSMPAVARPSKIDSEKIEKTLFNTPKQVNNYLSPLQKRFKRVEESKLMNAPFGLFHRVTLPSSERVHLLLTAKSSTQSEALAKIAVKLIREGLPKIKLSHSMAAPVSEFRKEKHAKFSEIADNFNTFMIQNNVDFNISSPQGKIQFQISFDGSSDPSEIMKQVAEGIRSLDYTTEQHAQEIQMKTNMLVGQWKGAVSNPRYLAEKEITDRLFTKEDVNSALDPNKLVQELSSVTFRDIEAFKNDIFSKEGKPFIVSVAANDTISNEALAEAVKEFHQVLSPKFYEEEKEYDDEELPFQMKPSYPKEVTMNEKYIIKNLKGRDEGLSAIGVRCNVDRNSKDFVALSVALQVLGGGMNSLLMDELRKKRGLTYGVYSRLRGGHQSSASWCYSFGTFDMKKIKEASPIMRKIFDDFVQNGISKEDFAVKRSNYEKSMKIRMENVNNLLNMTHNTVLNGAKTNLETISSIAANLTLKEVNTAIKRHLQGPAVHVLCGDFEKHNIKM